MVYTIVKWTVSLYTRAWRTDKQKQAGERNSFTKQEKRGEPSTTVLVTWHEWFIDKFLHIWGLDRFISTTPHKQQLRTFEFPHALVRYLDIASLKSSQTTYFYTAAVSWALWTSQDNWFYEAFFFAWQVHQAERWQAEIPAEKLSSSESRKKRTGRSGGVACKLTWTPFSNLTLCSGNCRIEVEWRLIVCVTVVYSKQHCNSHF